MDPGFRRGSVRYCLSSRTGVLGRASDSRDQRNVLIFPASVGSALPFGPAKSGALRIGGIVNSTPRSRWARGRVQGTAVMAPVPASASSTALRVSASPSPASNSRAARLTWSRQPRGRRRDCPTAPWRTARPGPALPVPPVLSSRDQASATPSVAISDPLTGDDGHENTMRIWQLHDCFVILTGGVSITRERKACVR